MERLCKRLKTAQHFEILTCQLSGNVMWLISGDNYLYSFEVTPSAPVWRVKIPGNLTAGVLRISPCPDNTVCVVIAPGYHPYVCKKHDSSVEELEPTALGMPTCCAWMLNEDGYYDCLFGMNSGLIVQYCVKREQYNVLCSTEENQILADMIVVNGKKNNYLLMVSEYEAMIFSGEDRVDQLLLDKKNNVRVGIQLIRGTNSQRICLEEGDGMYRIALLIKGYILEMTSSAHDPTKLEQRVYDIEWASAFTATEYGVFASRDNSVVFLPRTEMAWNVTFGLAQVHRIHRQGSVIWFVTENAIYYLKLDVFLKRLQEVAKEHNDIEFLSLISDDMSIQKVAFLKQTAGADFEDLGEMLIKKGWPFQVVMREFMDQGRMLISYLLQLLQRETVHQSALISLCFSLFIREVQTMKTEFLDFLQKYSKQLNRHQALKMMRDIDFDEGVETYEQAVAMNDDLVFDYIGTSRYENAVSLLPKIKSDAVVNAALMKLIKMGQDRLASNYLLHQSSNLVKLIPVLCEIPTYTCEIVKRNTFDFRLIPLRAYVLCESGNEDELIESVLSGILLSDVALRFARQYQLKKAIARCLIELGKIEKAVDIAHSISPETARELLDESGLRLEDQKRGWWHLLELSSGDSRRKGISLVLEREYFDFDEILDLIEDEDTLWTYSEVIEDAVESPPRRCFFGTSMRVDQSKFDTFLSLEDQCALCHRHLCGCDITVFNCGHVFHSHCITKHIEDMFFHGLARRDHVGSISCPTCGFLGTLRVANLLKTD